MGDPEEEAGSSAVERPFASGDAGGVSAGADAHHSGPVAEWERQEHEDEEQWPQELDPDPVGRLFDPSPFTGINARW